MAFFESHPDRDLLRTENIVNRWSTVIPEAAGRGEGFLNAVEQMVKGLDIPGLETKRMELETMKPNERTKGLYVRVVLKVTADPPVRGYITYFSAQDFGRHIVLSRLVEEATKAAHSPYESEVFSAYFSLVHAATLNVVKQITTELNQDFSRVNTRSTGIIDIA